MSSNMGINNYMNMFVQAQNGDGSASKRELSCKCQQSKTIIYPCVYILNWLIDDTQLRFSSF